MEPIGANLLLGACKLQILWSGRPGSNRRRPAWEAGILPLNYARSDPDSSVLLLTFQSRFKPPAPRGIANRTSVVYDRFDRMVKNLPSESEAKRLPLALFIWQMFCAK